ncbi:MAG: hypothetical protein QXF79_06905 [Ignisphaera sp.]
MSQHKSFLRKGQAELIGGIIAISVLLLSIGTIFYTVFAVSSQTSVQFSKRAQFEAERNSERISVTYESTEDSCIISNTGAVDITIARVWSENSFYTNFSPQNLSKGSSVKISRNNAPELIVTTRGNVFSIKAECDRQAGMTTKITEYLVNLQLGGGPFTSQNIVATTRFTSDSACILVRATVIESDKGKKSDKGTESDNLALLYNRSKSNMLIHQCDPANKNTYGWKNYDKSINYKGDASDIDYNTVKEITLINQTNGEFVGVDQGKTAMINLTFYNLTFIPRTTDVVTIYYKILANLSVQSSVHEITFSVVVELRSIADGKRFSMAGQTVTTGIQNKRGDLVGVIVGMAPFPKFFFNFSEGYYTVSIIINIVTGQGKAQVKQLNLEYIAITGAQILWPPKPD